MQIKRVTGNILKQDSNNVTIRHLLSFLLFIVIGSEFGFDVTAATSVQQVDIGNDGNVIMQESCIDSDHRCEFWASEGECRANPNYMLYHCRKSCNTCQPVTANNDLDDIMADYIEATMEFGDKQNVEGIDHMITQEVVKNSVDYMRNLKKNNSIQISQKTLDLCINRHELCAFWAAIGECDENAAYMVTNCAPSCLSCDKIDFETRCPPRSPDLIPGLYPGELNTMFERIIEEGNSDRTNYTVTVHSQPAKYISKSPSENDAIEGPWVVTFDNFLSKDECNRLIELGYETDKGYERSMDVGSKKFDGSFDGYESHSRTSHNAWCSAKEKCRFDPMATLIMERIATVTGIPAVNSEDFQVLRYDEGQFYKEHHDYIDHQKDRICGPRILTFFLYLSDVEAGGGTAFPTMNNLTVVPKLGRALLWPSVIDSDPSVKETRTRHEALKVWRGRKYAANAWIHLYDYLTPQSWGCT